MKVTVTVKLFATFRVGREKIQVMELAEGTTPEDVLAVLGIPAEEVKILLVNGYDAALTRVLIDGDVMAIFPPVGGG